MRKTITYMAQRSVLACALLIFIPGGALAATWTVTKTADTNDGVCDADCSLREAIDVAASGDTINFSTLFNSLQTITLTSGSLSISQSLTILGSGANLLTISGNFGAFPPTVFSVSAGIFNPVYLSGMTITGGSTGINNNNADLTVDSCTITGNTGTGIINSDELIVNASTITENTGSSAGGIKNLHIMTVTNSTISNNTGDSFFAGAGGIYNSGTLDIINSTISGNYKRLTAGNGGGIWSDDEVTITNSTITNNSADGVNSAGGICKSSGSGTPATIRNTIVAANVNNSTMPDVAVIGGGGGFTSGGYNLVGNVGTATGFTNLGDQTGTGAAPLDPLLEALGNYGGPTETHKLQTSSPAIDKGYSFGSTTDQRGMTRPFDQASYPNATGGDGSDIGAYELQQLVVISGGVYVTAGDSLYKAHVLMIDGNGNTRIVLTDKRGLYHFDKVEADHETYVFRVMRKPYRFLPRMVMVNGPIEGLDFMALPRR